MWPFRLTQSPVDETSRHGVTLDLIEQVAALRGQVRALESEWDDMRGQIRKGYQRMEKAHERLEEDPEPSSPAPYDEDNEDATPRTFADKLRAMKA